MSRKEKIIWRAEKSFSASVELSSSESIIVREMQKLPVALKSYKKNHMNDRVSEQKRSD